MSSLTQGTKIICPDCGKMIARTTVELMSGMEFKAGYFLFAKGMELRNGDKAVCLECGGEWCVGGSLYTEGGWWPDKTIQKRILK